MTTEVTGSRMLVTRELEAPDQHRRELFRSVIAQATSFSPTNTCEAGEAAAGTAGELPQHTTA
jgi:hypothetical protein